MTELQENRLRDFLRFGNMSHETRDAIHASLAEIERLRSIMAQISDVLLKAAKL